MESNKSKGVEAIIHAIVLAMPQLKELPTHAPEHMELVRDAVAEVVYNSLAHPQQSEGVEEAAEGLTKEQIKAITDTAREFCLVGMRGFDHDVQQFTCRCFNGDNCTCYKNYKNALQTLQPKGEPQAAAPSEPVVGQAAEAKAKIIADVADEVLGKDFCREDVKDLADIYDKYLQPSEPAALKEFYCIGDKDNLFQCEEQCEDCKKGAALKDGEERAIREIWNKYSGTTWVVPPEKFTAALKEFTSLLTNHKS